MPFLYLLKKLLFAMGDFHKFFKPTTHPRLLMTLLVKNEEDILEKNLLFHKKMGVDGFIVTDNNSSDQTPAIIQKYIDKGWIKEVINEKATDYKQKLWVDRMVWKAKTIYKADWVINADADELWYSPTGNLKTELSSTASNVLMCNMKCVYPEEGKAFYEWNHTVKPVTNITDYDLSPFSLFARQNLKVIHRTNGYIQISMGNHKVAMFPKRKANSRIYVYHYNIRGRQQFLDKMINGGKQLEQNPNKHGGRHWRYFYRLYKEGLLDSEYDRVIGVSCYERLCKDGFVQTDNTIREIFKELERATGG